MSTKDWWKIAKQISNFKNKKEIPPTPSKLRLSLFMITK
jgi:hypothetical protein